MNPCYFKGCSYFCLIYKWNEWIELLLSFGLQNYESLRKTKRCFIWITWIILILKELNQKHRSHYLFLITATKYTINITLIHTTTRRKTITKITSFLICSFNSPKILVHFNCLTSETLCLATRNANILLTQVFPHKTILHLAYAKKEKIPQEKHRTRSLVGIKKLSFNLSFALSRKHAFIGTSYFQAIKYPFTSPNQFQFASLSFKIFNCLPSFTKPCLHVSGHLRYRTYWKTAQL